MRENYPELVIKHYPPNKTLVILHWELGVTYAGYAICSEDDQYSRRRGKSIALGRLLRALPEPIQDKVVDKFSDQWGKVSFVPMYKAYEGKQVR